MFKKKVRLSPFLMEITILIVTEEEKLIKYLKKLGIENDPLFLVDGSFFDYAAAAVLETKEGVLFILDGRGSGINPEHIVHESMHILQCLESYLALDENTAVTRRERELQAYVISFVFSEACKFANSKGYELQFTI